MADYNYQDPNNPVAQASTLGTNPIMALLASTLGTPQNSPNAIDPTPGMNYAPSLGQSPTTDFSSAPIGQTGQTPQPQPDQSLQAPGQITDAQWKAHHSGVQGVARDIFGHLGDFLLSKLGLPTEYAPSQERHKINFAQQGINIVDPNTPDAIANAGIQRLMNVNPTYANQQANVRSDNERASQAQKAQQDYHQQILDMRQNVIDVRQDRDMKNQLGALYDMKTGELASDAAEKYPALRDAYNATDTGKRNPLPDAYNPAQIETMYRGAVPVAKQIQESIQLRRDAASADARKTANDIAQQRADTGDGSLAERTRHDGVTESKAGGRGGTKPLMVRSTDAEGHPMVETSDGRTFTGSGTAPGKTRRPAPTPSPTNLPSISASQIPAGARTGTLNGRKVVSINGAVHFVN